MPRFAICEECLSIMRELADALKESAREAQERERNASVPFTARLQNMTEAEWNQMARTQESSRLGQARRKAVEHNLLTGHRVPTIPFGNL